MRGKPVAGHRNGSLVWQQRWAAYVIDDVVHTAQHLAGAKTRRGIGPAGEQDVGATARHRLRVIESQAVRRNPWIALGTGGRHTEQAWIGQLDDAIHPLRETVGGRSLPVGWTGCPSRWRA